jgi:hypothetical protein
VQKIGTPGCVKVNDIRFAWAYQYRVSTTIGTKVVVGVPGFPERTTCVALSLLVKLLCRRVDLDGVREYASVVLNAAPATISALIVDANAC